MNKFLFILWFTNVLNAQFQFKAKVFHQSLPIENCVVTLGNQNTLTNNLGEFSFENLSSGNYILKIQHISFEVLEQKIKIEKNENLQFFLIEKSALLKEVLVQETMYKIDKTIVNQVFINNNHQGSLMKSLENLPGINAVGVGVQASKPVIRGMGFTRVAVVENGIKHEGQQWGADHGLEIESNQVETVEVLKGVDAMLFGSDAVGGVLKINSNKKPIKIGFSGSFDVFGKTINEGINASFNLNFNQKNWFIKCKNSITDFGDYHVPTNQIVYLTQIVPVVNQKLKNTAGREINHALQIGFEKNNFQSTWTASLYDFTMGFFPAAHGIPSPSKALDDGDSRNIDFPRQEVLHFKILGNNSWHWNENKIEILTSFQKNVRKELSFFHSHYPTQPVPAINPELELYFNLQTIDLQAIFHKNIGNSYVTLGLQSQNQVNSINGFQFLLPNYQREAYGIFSSFQKQWNEAWQSKIGLRFDYGNYEIERFFDTNFYQYLIEKGTLETTALNLATRSKGIKTDFKSINYGITTTYLSNEKSKFTHHIGSVFRFPTVMELASNGVHHGSFRHEKGDANLSIEKGFQSELSYYFKHQNYELNTNFYLFYFDNYIFIKPSGEFSILPHSGQTYQYTQSKAIMGGIELQWKKIWNQWKTNLVLEYLQNQELSENGGFGLPFSSAPNGFFEIIYQLKNTKVFEDTTIFSSFKHSLEQKNIAQNEDFTSSWTVFNLGLSSNINWLKTKIISRLNVFNLLNTKYFNHTSFYRPIQIPEQGRNIQLSFGIRF